MRNECNIIRDILPLYAENMVSSDTVSYVEEHLKTCETCRKEFEQTKETQTVNIPINTAPLINLKKKMAGKRIRTIILTAVFVITLFVSIFAVLDAPMYLPYTEDLLTVEPVGDSGIKLTFDKSVTDFHYNMYQDPDGEGEFYYCDVEAWSSLWDKWFSSGDGELSITIFPRESYPITVMYVPNDGTENVWIYGENIIDGGVVTLPRLVLGYYFITAVIVLASVIVVWFVVRKKAEIRVWVERIALYPVSYIISHFIVSGTTTVSYSMPRDFFLIISISLLLYCGLLLVYSIWKLKKEIKEINS